MTDQPYVLKDVQPPLALHAMKHIGEFKNPSLGKVLNIHTSTDLENHVLKTLFHQETKCFAGKDNRDIFYNSSTNTLIIINPQKSQNGQIYGGTIFRPRDKEKYFLYLLKKEQEVVNSKIILHEKNGIIALRPEIAKEFAKGYLQQRQGKGEKPEKLNSSQKPGFNEKLPDLIKPPVAAKELNVKTPQGADQAKPLASRKLTR